MSFIKILLLAIILLAIGMILFAFQILFKKNGHFPITSIGHNPEMRKRGITCEKCDEATKCSRTREIKNLEG